MVYKQCEICKKKKKDVDLRNTDYNECNTCYKNRSPTLISTLETVLESPTTSPPSPQNATTLVKQRYQQPSQQPIPSTSVTKENEKSTTDWSDMESLQNCNVCRKDVTATTECSICSKWLCQQCCDFSEEEFKFTSTHVSIKFICQTCLPRFDQMIESINNANTVTEKEDTTINQNVNSAIEETHTNNQNEPENDLDRMGTRIDKLETMINNLTQIITNQENEKSKISKDPTIIEKYRTEPTYTISRDKTGPWTKPPAAIYQSNINSTRTTSQIPQPPIQLNNNEHSMAQDTIINTLEEYKNREKRRNNLVIYGLPETGFLPNQLQQLSRELDITGTEITKFMRLGQIQQNKARPVLISIKDTEQRDAFLARSKKLRTANSYFNNVYIAPDYTPKERDENRKLVEQLRARRNNGEEFLTIRRGKIIKVPPPQTQTHLRI